MSPVAKPDAKTDWVVYAIDQIEKKIDIIDQKLLGHIKEEEHQFLEIEKQIVSLNKDFDNVLKAIEGMQISIKDLNSLHSSFTRVHERLDDILKESSMFSTRLANIEYHKQNVDEYIQKTEIDHVHISLVRIGIRALIWIIVSVGSVLGAVQVLLPILMSHNS